MFPSILKQRNIAAFFLFILFLAVSFEVRSQTLVHRGVEAYRTGRNREAVDLLSQAVKQKEFRTDGEMWNYLGLAYFALEDNKNSRKAFEKAAKLAPTKAIYRVNLGYAYLMNRKIDKAQSEVNQALKIDPNISGAYYVRGVADLWEGKLDSSMSDSERIIQLDPLNHQGYVLKSDVLMAKLGKRVLAGSTPKAEISFLKHAVDVLELGLASVPKGSGLASIESELQGKRAFYAYFAREKPDPLTPKPEPEPGVTPFKIISKQRPAYTDQARQANVEGTIKMAVLFGANGKIEHVLFLNRLGYSLDDQAIRALRTWTFEPKTKDGKPVSTVNLVSFGFNIY